MWLRYTSVHPNGYKSHGFYIVNYWKRLRKKGQLFALEEKPLESTVNHAGQVKKRNVTYKCRMQEWRRKHSISYFSCGEITFLWAQAESWWQSQERHPRPVFNTITALFNILLGHVIFIFCREKKKEGWKKFVCVLTDRPGRAAAPLTWKTWRETRWWSFTARNKETHASSKTTLDLLCSYILGRPFNDVIAPQLFLALQQIRTVIFLLLLLFLESSLI